MSEYAYSPSANKFYPLLLKGQYESNGTWPNDAKEIDDLIVKEYNGTPPDGKFRSSGRNGNPEWVDAPPPDEKMLLDIADSEKNALLYFANEKIRVLEYAVSLGIATEDEKKSYDEWRAYAVMVSRIDIRNPDWPEKP